MSLAPHTVAVTEALIFAALRDCYDAELRLNLVDLGIVLSVTAVPDDDAPGAGIAGVPERFRVQIELTPGPAGPLAAEEAETYLRAQIEGRLGAFEQVSIVHIQFHTTPAWTPLRLTPAGRKQLKLDQPGGLIQISLPDGDALRRG